MSDDEIRAGFKLVAERIDALVQAVGLLASGRTAPGALSLTQADAFLAARGGTAHRLVKQGKLAAVKVGSRLRVARVELERYLREGRSPPAPPPTPTAKPSRRRTPKASARAIAEAIRALPHGSRFAPVSRLAG